MLKRINIFSMSCRFMKIVARAAGDTACYFKILFNKRAGFFVSGS